METSTDRRPGGLLGQIHYEIHGLETKGAERERIVEAVVAFEGLSFDEADQTLTGFERAITSNGWELH